MENRGVEFSLTHRNKIRGVNYSLTGTFTKNVNEIVSMAGKNELYFFPDGKPVSSGSDYVTAIKKGYEAGAFFVMPTAGVINTEQKLAEYQKLQSSAVWVTLCISIPIMMVFLMMTTVFMPVVVCRIMNLV